MQIPEEGQRIRLTHMGADPCPIPAGATGTVTFATDLRHFDNTVQVGVQWDAPHDARTLSLVLPHDSFEVLQ